MKFFRFVGLPVAFSFLFLQTSSAQIELLSQLRALTQKNQWEEAQKLVEKNPRSQVPKDELHLFDFSSALIQLKLGNYTKAKEHFTQYQNNHTKLRDYAGFYLATLKGFLNQPDESEKDLREIIRVTNNTKLKTDALKELGNLELKRKDYRSANAHFNEIVKRVRIAEDSTEIAYSLAITERGLGNTKKFCQQIIKLYSEYPQYDRLRFWGPNLAENLFEGSKTGCQTNFDEFRMRVRFLMWSGYDQKALEEITEAKAKNLFVPIEIDQALAYYHVQEGEVTKAWEILKKYEDQLGNQVGYILNYAGILARAGELNKSIQYYYRAHLLSPRDQTGRQALYQASFLSYQGRDYTLAEKRFQEFLKKYPRSGLTQDAKWHLAWIKYLQKDYDQAIQDFKNLDTVAVKKRGRKRNTKLVIKQDRVKYWLAMSYLRLKKIEPAKQIFEGLSRDSLLGYYSIAAQSRLDEIERLQKETSRRRLANHPVRIQRFSIKDYLLPSEDSRQEDLSLESEDQLRFESGMDFKNAGADSETTRLVVQEENETEVDHVDAGETEEAMRNPRLLTRMETARDLMILGLTEWAKWDLYEVERATKNREYLKLLIADYSTLGQYHRSSYLAQTYFGDLRQRMGIAGAKNFWEQAYPRAFEVDVLKSSKQYNVNNELIWAIMKAESQFRIDAISPVGALGLMQVMPATGMKVSKIMKEKEFRSSDLLKSESAIRYGSRYLRKLSDKFKDLTPLVAAGYNAGPHRVKSWLYSFGDLDTDEFIEHIPFLETRNYVKRVLSYQFIYSKIYKGEADFTRYLAQRVPMKVEGHPPFKESWDEI